jgi:hypothetical protein
MRLEWLSNWELIHTELAILISVVWLGLRRIESLIGRGLQSAGLVKLPEGKSKCPACGGIIWIPSMEILLEVPRKALRTTTIPGEPRC